MCKFLKNDNNKIKVFTLLIIKYLLFVSVLLERQEGEMKWITVAASTWTNEKDEFKLIVFIIAGSFRVSLFIDLGFP